MTMHSRRSRANIASWASHLASLSLFLVLVLIQPGFSTTGYLVPWPHTLAILGPWTLDLGDQGQILTAGLDLPGHPLTLARRLDSTWPADFGQGRLVPAPDSQELDLRLEGPASPVQELKVLEGDRITLDPQASRGFTVLASPDPGQARLEFFAPGFDPVVRNLPSGRSLDLDGQGLVLTLVRVQGLKGLVWRHTPGLWWLWAALGSMALASLIHLGQGLARNQARAKGRTQARAAPVGPRPGSSLWVWTSSLCLLVLVALLGIRGLATGRLPLASLPGFAGLLGTLTCLWWTWQEFRARGQGGRLPMALRIGLLAVLPGLGLWSTGSPGGLASPLLDSPWLGIHVTAALLAYSSLIIAFIQALRGLVAKAAVAQPAWRGMMTWMGRAQALLGLTIQSGMVWAEYSWGNFWTWDPKETWALLTWLACLILVHRGRHLPKKGLLWAGILVFGLALFSFLGVSLLLPGLHSY